MTRKQFSNYLFNMNDERARNTVEALKDFFGVDEFKDSKTRYAIDREGYRDGVHVLNVEVEIKQHWKDGHTPFPFEDINLPLRKEKYFGLREPTYFVIFSADCKGGVIFSDRTASQAPKVEVPNRYVPKGELFFKIPVSRASHFKI